MIDDVKNQETVEEKPEVKVDPYESKALELGWRPESEWEGEPEDFVDAKEFVRREPFFKKIEHQGKELKQLRQALESFKEHHNKVKETEYNRALENLKKARRTAMTEGETEQALLIEDQIEEIQNQKQQIDQDLYRKTREPELRPEFLEWKSQNNWYQKDRAMTAFADDLGVEYAGQGLSPEEVLQKVTKEVRKEFPNKFTNPKRDAPSSVEGGSRVRATAVDNVVSEMTEQEVKIMNSIVRSGVMTKEEYIKDYKNIKG
jgi:hypothetical protein